MIQQKMLTQHPLALILHIDLSDLLLELWWEGTSLNHASVTQRLDLRP